MADDMKLDLHDLFGDSLAPAEESKKTEDDDEIKKREAMLKEREAEIARKEKELEKKLKAQLAERETAIKKASEEAKKEEAEQAQEEKQAQQAMQDAESDEKTKQWAQDVLAKSEEQKEKLSSEQKDFELLMMFEQLRDVMYFKLAPIVGDKATKTMLVRSLEKVIGKVPDVLKNGNFNDKGSPTEGGELNAKKIIENKNKLEVDKGLERLLLGLKTLLEFRLLAVQKGLGQAVVKGIIVAMNERLGELEKSHGKDSPAILRKIMPRA